MKKNSCSSYDPSGEGRLLTYYRHWRRGYRLSGLASGQDALVALKTPPSWVAVPQEQVMTRFIHIKTKEVDKLPGMVHFAGLNKLPVQGSVELLDGFDVLNPAPDGFFTIYSAVKKDYADRLSERLGADTGKRPNYVPTYIALYNLFQFQYPARQDRVYVILHMQENKSFFMLCAKGKFIAIRNLQGVGSPADGSTNDLAKFGARFATQLNFNLQSLHRKQGLPLPDEVLLVDTTGTLRGLETEISRNMNIPASPWVIPNIPASHYVCLGLSIMEMKPNQEGFLYLRLNGHQAAKPHRAITPVASFRVALHLVAALLLFLTINLLFTHHSQQLETEYSSVSQALQLLQPQVAESLELYDQNQTLSAQLANSSREHNQRITGVLDELIALAPGNISIQRITIGGGGQQATTPQPRRINVATSGAADESANTVTITGVADDAIAFADYFELLEGSGLFSRVSFRQAETAEEAGGLRFTIEGQL